jgi:hypothetical protein
MIAVKLYKIENYLYTVTDLYDALSLFKNYRCEYLKIVLLVMKTETVSIMYELCSMLTWYILKKDIAFCIELDACGDLIGT